MQMENSHLSLYHAGFTSSFHSIRGKTQSSMFHHPLLLYLLSTPMLQYHKNFRSQSDTEDDGALEFFACIRVLADKVGILARQRAELLDRYSIYEAAKKQLTKELEERKELVKTLSIYTPY